MMIINDAEDMMFGTQEVQRVMCRNTTIWERSDRPLTLTFLDGYQTPEFVSVQNASGDLDGLYDFLNQYAVPKYFESVTKNATEGFVSCFYERTECFRIYADHSKEDTMLHNEVIFRIGIGYAGYWKNAVILENAIILTIDNNWGTHRRSAEVLTRTKGGRPVFFYHLYPTYSENVTTYDNTENILPSEASYACCTAGDGRRGYTLYHGLHTDNTAELLNIHQVPWVYLPSYTPQEWDNGQYLIVTDTSGTTYFQCNAFLIKT